MIITVTKEIKLENGLILPVGHTTVSISISQSIKGGPITIYPAHPTKNGEFYDVIIIGMDDLDKIYITPEFLTGEEVEIVKNFKKSAEEVKRILNQ